MLQESSCSASLSSSSSLCQSLPCLRCSFASLTFSFIDSAIEIDVLVIVFAILTYLAYACELLSPALAHSGIQGSPSCC